MNMIKDVFTFNREAGLFDKGMDPFVELAYVLEESFEGYEEAYNIADENGDRYKPGDEKYPTARQLGLSLANSIKDSFERNGFPQPDDVAEFDKSLDAIVFHLGKLGKMRLTEDQVARGFTAVHHCNMAKLRGPKDDLGKQLKPEGWTGPEEALQSILDERN